MINTVTLIGWILIITVTIPILLLISIAYTLYGRDKKRNAAHWKAVEKAKEERQKQRR
jgi:hypothetical protein